MPTNFPATGIDSYSTKVDGVDYPKAADINDLQLAIVAIETKVGKDSSAVTSTHDFKLSHIEDGDKAVSLVGVETIENKRINKRVVTVATGATLTPAGDTSDVVYQSNTQGAGTLTMAAPTGTPVDGQTLIIRLKATNAQTYSWNAIYRGSADFALPTSHTGGSKTDYLGFVYNSSASKWDLLALTKGF